MSNTIPTPERLILTAIIGAKLGPALAAWGLSPADAATLTPYIIAGIPVAYHFASVYLPRVLNRLFPPAPGVAPK